MTWNNKPFTGGIIATDSVYRGQTASFDITNSIKKWISGTANNGIVLHTNGIGITHWKKLYASENGPELAPYMSVVYSYPAPAPPDGISYSNGNGDNTGYINLSWQPVSGAIGYDLLLFNGQNYERFDIGNVTSWSTKGKGIWPTSQEIATGRYELHHDGHGTELAADPSAVYANAGTEYATYKTHFVRIIAKYPSGEESPDSGPAGFYIPLDKPKTVTGKAFSNVTQTNSGYIQLNWKPVTNATGYKVLMFNGKDFTEFDAGNNTNWTTQGKGIWPTSEELSVGRYQLHPDGQGT